MSDYFTKRPLTQIDLEAGLAEATKRTDGPTEAQNSRSLENGLSSKRPENTQDVPMRIGAHQQSTQQPVKVDANLMVSAPRAPKTPRQTYEKLFDLQLGDCDYYTVAEQTNPDVEGNPVVIIKTFTGPKADSHVQVIRGIQHNRFVNAQLFLAIDDGYLVSFDFMPMSLCEIAGNPLLNDLRLASILGQIVDGLLYLEQKSLEHSQLTCSNILIDTLGNVKLWGQEHIQSSTAACQHAKAVSEIIMYLAHGQASESGSVGLDDPARFPLTFEFLSATQRTSKIASIAQEPLLAELPWHKRRIAGLFTLTNTWNGSGYRFPARE
ncbi:protein kinasedomain-containing protein [Cordyceps javanica]|uniref:Protein kinasedomain-containing protein n=1 Tax=Cordyceps javanica TaxID=43265 RepID=A0A545VIN2_9HYPO|nr:protein kinasedomain-containing protein [Cordyceps javanica]TQW01594.1 protein kinase domain-containing protein [Cordyceps javanica]